MRRGLDPVEVRIATHRADAAAAFRDRVLEVWTTAFGPVDDAEDWRSRFWEQHRSRDGFRLVTASMGEELHGFGWGYTGERGQWWADRVADALAADGLGAGGLATDGLAADGTEWVGGHFEFVELAVRPTHQGHGLGGRLHDALMEGLPHARSLLQTDADPQGSGHRLYRARGWSVLGELAPGKVVMGKRLGA